MNLHPYMDVPLLKIICGTLFFAGEIGGFMGLLLGGSVLTILELLDLIIYNIVRKILTCRHREDFAHKEGSMEEVNVHI